MDNETLTALTQKLSLRYFGKPFRHTAIFNGRLRTTGGRYKLNDGSIEINPKVLIHHDDEELTGIIKHELCHYHLHQEGRGYRHGDRDFKELLQKTGSPRYCKPMDPEAERKPRTIHLYRCSDCSLLYRRKRRMDMKKYRCGKCSGRIVYAGREDER